MVQSLTTEDILYPDSDGQPMSDNTLQYQWIVRLASNLKYLLKDQTAFVAGDLLWYPVRVEKPPVPSQAPDVLVALGRPDGYRGSYKQWEEANIAPQVVFEILSPSNTAREMIAKQAFYQQYGVLEFYVYDPERLEFWGQIRERCTQDFTPITHLNLPWISPLLGIRFQLFEDGMEVFYPNGDRFEDPVETRDRLDRTQIRLNRTQSERDQYRQERDRAQQERDRLRAKLIELGLDPDQV